MTNNPEHLPFHQMVANRVHAAMWMGRSIFNEVLWGRVSTAGCLCRHIMPLPPHLSPKFSHPYQCSNGEMTYILKHFSFRFMFQVNQYRKQLGYINCGPVQNNNDSLKNQLQRWLLIKPMEVYGKKILDKGSNWRNEFQIKWSCALSL